MATNQKAINVSAGNASASTITKITDNMPGVPCPDPAGYKYVGARYVPLFAEPIEWNNQSTYEPLTIVLHEGNSYTSKQYVPVGIDISNEEYWAQTGNYNAQIEIYEQKVDELENNFNLSKRYITLEQFGAIGDGITNDTTAIQNALNYAVENQCLLTCNGKKTFLTTGLNVNGILCADFNKSTFKAYGSTQTMFQWTNGSSEQAATYDPYQFGGFLKNLMIDGNNVATYGIYLLTGKRQFIQNIEVANCEIGYRVASANESVLDTIRFFNCGTGIENATYDVQYSNVYGRFTKIGINNTGALRLNIGHIWVDETHNQSESIGIITSGRTVIEGFYFDSYETCIQCLSGSSLYMSNCSFIMPSNSTLFNVSEEFNTNQIYVSSSYVDVADSGTTYNITNIDQASSRINFNNCRLINYANYNPHFFINYTLNDGFENSNLTAIFKDNFIHIQGTIKVTTQIESGTITNLLTLENPPSGISFTPLEYYRDLGYSTRSEYGLSPFTYHPINIQNNVLRILPSGTIPANNYIVINFSYPVEYANA